MYPSAAASIVSPEGAFSCSCPGAAGGGQCPYQQIAGGQYRPPPGSGCPASAAGTAPDLDQPVPYTLTPKARALLDQVPDGQWACGQCGAAYFGTPPGDGLCPGCQGRS